MKINCLLLGGISDVRRRQCLNIPAKFSVNKMDIDPLWKVYDCSSK